MSIAAVRQPLAAQQPDATVSSFEERLQVKIRNHVQLEAVPDSMLSGAGQHTEIGSQKQHDSLWNGVLIGAAIGIPAAHLLANMGGGLDSGDTIRATIGGAIVGAAIGFMVDAARAN